MWLLVRPTRPGDVSPGRGWRWRTAHTLDEIASVRVVYEIQDVAFIGIGARVPFRFAIAVVVHPLDRASQRSIAPLPGVEPESLEDPRLDDGASQSSVPSSTYILEAR